MNVNYRISIVLIILLGYGVIGFSQNIKTAESSDSLVVIWSSSDPYVAEKVCFMYTHAAKSYKWFDEVVLIVWGPSAKLLSENIMLQEKVKAMKKSGVILKACIACANSYNVTEKLREIGVEVIPMGVPLTNYLKRNWKVLNF